MFKSNTTKDAIILSSVAAASFAIVIPSVSNADHLTPIQYNDFNLDKKKPLRLGYAGHPVRVLQLELKENDFYHEAIDGKFGISTQKAIKEFQKFYGLRSNGIADQKTIDRLNEVKLIQVKTLKLGDYGKEVEELQRNLQKLNYYHGEIDGIYGLHTEDAVKTYQSQNNLLVDGKAGKKTISHLKYNKNKKGKSHTTVKVKQVSNYSVNTAIINIAKSFMGTPYVWGGESPGGFDCSGFLMYIYRQEGINIPRTVSEIWNFGLQVDKLSVGDIVFFQTYKPGPSHAGIYLGNNEFIHTDSNKGVTVSSLNNSYWNKRYLGAKRIVQIK